MGTIITQSKHYSDIANAIRDNKATEETFTPDQMADEINNACVAQYEKGFQEGMQTGHRIESGVFTLEKDSSSLTLNISSGVKMIEILPTGTPGVSTSARVPISYLFASEVLQKNNITYEGKGCIVQYKYSGNRTSFYVYDTTNGFTVDFGELLVFEAGMPYAWTAYFWQE